MKDYRLPKISMYGELASGHRNRGAPKKRYKDALKKNTSACHIRPSEWSTLEEDRSILDTPLKELLKPSKKVAGPPYRRKNR